MIEFMLDKIVSFAFVITIAVFLTILDSAPSSAQAVGDLWSDPVQLSHNGYEAGEPILVADDHGLVHVFWGETRVDGASSVVMYRQFDGDSWSDPIDVLVSQVGRILRVSAAIGPDDRLNVAWTDGVDLLYSSAYVAEALTAQGWSGQTVIAANVRPNYYELQVAASGDLHVLYSSYLSDDRGVFLVRVAAGDTSWSRPIPVDTDIEPSWSPWIVRLAMGDDRELHAFWNHGDERGHASAVRYARSLDGGMTWSPHMEAFTPNGGDGLASSIPYPSMIVQDRTVHLIWALSQQFADGTRFGLRRRYMVSLDAGATWSVPQWIHGAFEGMADGDGLAADGAGRLHWVSQVRQPMGIYHSVWQGGAWATPNMIYRIMFPGAIELDGGIHAHKTRAAVRAGDQLVVAFTTAPDDDEQLLYAMVKEPTGVGALETTPIRMPERAETAPTATPQPIPATPTAEPTAINAGVPMSERTSSTNGRALALGLVPMLGLILLVLAFSLKRR